MDKPDSSTYCPASGKKLRLKDCVAVKLTRVREGESGLYMDPVTMETLTNSTRLVVIAPTGVWRGAGCGVMVVMCRQQKGFGCLGLGGSLCCPTLVGDI
jgi:hypothetical protein